MKDPILKLLRMYISQRLRKEFKSGGAKFDGHHGGRAVPLPQPARGVL